jgi:hypothetical protein
MSQQPKSFSTKRFLSISVLILLNGLSYGQNEASTTFFGNLGLDFRPATPQPIYPINMISRESSTSICDENGDILFYTNGGNSPSAPSYEGAIWNRNHDIMENGILGDSSGCISSFQGAIIVPFPSNDLKSTDDLYYLFTKDCLESSFTTPNFNSGLTYAVVDISANGGDGKVISKNNVIEPYSATSVFATAHEPVAAILHGNQTDYWLFSYTNDSLYRIQIDANGIGDKVMMIPSEGGRITFAPDRQHLCLNRNVYEFDAYTGDIIFIASLPGVASSLVFSPDGSKLYNNDMGTLNQYDFNQTDFLTSKTQITNLNYIYSMWLAPDHRIWLYLGDADNFAGRIRCPNAQGNACDFSQQSLYLGGGKTYYGFPNIMAHHLYYSGSCTANSTKIDGIEKEKKLIMVIDLMGRETEFKSGIPLILIYSDGTRKMVH